MSNKAKLFVAIILVVLMIPAMGTVYIKDSLHSNDYCATCHQEYQETYVDADAGLEDNFHHQQGVSCQACHTRSLGESVVEAANFITGNYYYPFTETELSMEKCFQCHVSYQDVIDNTRDTFEEEFGRNPHDSHNGELNCGKCHNMHRNSVLFCSKCHDVPIPEGWKALEKEQ